MKLSEVLEAKPNTPIHGQARPPGRFDAVLARLFGSTARSLTLGRTISSLGLAAVGTDGAAPGPGPQPGSIQAVAPGGSPFEKGLPFPDAPQIKPVLAPEQPWYLTQPWMYRPGTKETPILGKMYYPPFAQLMAQGNLLWKDTPTPAEKQFGEMLWYLATNPDHPLAQGLGLGQILKAYKHTPEVAERMIKNPRYLFGGPYYKQLVAELGVPRTLEEAAQFWKAWMNLLYTLGTTSKSR